MSKYSNTENSILGESIDSTKKSEFLKTKEILDKLNDPNQNRNLSDGIPYIPVFENDDVLPHTEEKEASFELGERFFSEIFWCEYDDNLEDISANRFKNKLNQYQ